MNFLKKTFAQFGDLFRSIAPRNQITVGLLLVISGGCLLQQQVSRGDDYLFGGAPMQQPALEKVEQAFGKAGLNGFSIEGGRVKVPHAQRAIYLAALADAKALPPNVNVCLWDDGKQFVDLVSHAPNAPQYAVFCELNMHYMLRQIPYSRNESTDRKLWESPTQREERLRQAREEAMSLVISKMKGIEKASVFIDNQEPSGLHSTALKTAAVTVFGTRGTPLDDDQVDSILSFVVSANAGLKRENVTICDGNGTVHLDGEANDGRDGECAHAVRKAEGALNDKVHKVLAYIPNVAVTSTVTLDLEKGNRSVEEKNDPHVGLTLKKATVSVGIPTSYFAKVWQGRNPAKEGEEAKEPDAADVDKIREEIMQDVRNAVTPLLSVVPDVKDPTLLVTVTSFQDITAETADSAATLTRPRSSPPCRKPTSPSR